MDMREKIRDVSEIATKEQSFERVANLHLSTSSSSLLLLLALK